MSNNNPVNDMTAPVSWLINDLDKAIKTKSTQIMPTIVENGPSNASHWQHRRMDATEQIKNLIYIYIWMVQFRQEKRHKIIIKVMLLCYKIESTVDSYEKKHY